MSIFEFYKLKKNSAQKNNYKIFISYLFLKTKKKKKMNLDDLG